MYEKSSGLRITNSNDKRITPIGYFLRKSKIDELPQLYNIANKTMSFVGPRPEVYEYVDLSNDIWMEVLSVRPGLTDPIMLNFRNEQELLDQCDKDKELFYINKILPYKLKISLSYIRRRSWITDLRIILYTIIIIFLPSLSTYPTKEKFEKFK